MHLLKQSFPSTCVPVTPKKMQESDSWRKTAR
jgi:hypothetical protein